MAQSFDHRAGEYRTRRRLVRTITRQNFSLSHDPRFHVIHGVELILGYPFERCKTMQSDDQNDGSPVNDQNNCSLVMNNTIQYDQIPSLTLIQQNYDQNDGSFVNDQNDVFLWTIRTMILLWNIRTTVLLWTIRSMVLLWTMVILWTINDCYLVIRYEQIPRLWWFKQATPLVVAFIVIIPYMVNDGYIVNHQKDGSIVNDLLLNDMNIFPGCDEWLVLAFSVIIPYMVLLWTMVILWTIRRMVLLWTISC